MTVRDLTPEEIRYAGREVLADRVTKLQSERAVLESEVKALRELIRQMQKETA